MEDGDIAGSCWACIQVCNIAFFKVWLKPDTCSWCDEAKRHGLTAALLPTGKTQVSASITSSNQHHLWTCKCCAPARSSLRHETAQALLEYWLSADVHSNLLQNKPLLGCRERPSSTASCSKEDTGGESPVPLPFAHETLAEWHLFEKPTTLQKKFRLSSSIRERIYTMNCLSALSFNP